MTRLINRIRWWIWFLRCPCIGAMSFQGMDRRAQRVIVDRWLDREPGTAGGRSQPENARRDRPDFRRP